MTKSEGSTAPTPDKLEIPEAAVELLPCPFCGGTDLMVLPRTCDKNTPYDPNDRAMPAVRCHTCYGEAVGKDWSGPKTAIAAWNRRVPHIPDRGYAEVGVKPLIWSGDGNNQFASTELGLFFSLKPDVGDVWHLIRHERSAETHSVWKTIGEAKTFAQTKWEELVRSALIAPPAPADNGEPETHDEDSILDVISGNLRMESWVAGKTLTVMFDMESGERRFAKLRLTKIAAQPSPADLKGEPE